MYILTHLFSYLYTFLQSQCLIHSVTERALATFSLRTSRRRECLPLTLTLELSRYVHSIYIYIPYTRTLISAELTSAHAGERAMSKHIDVCIRACVR